MYISLLLFAPFCLFIMDYMNYGNLRGVFRFIGSFTMPYLFELTVILFVFGVLLLLCRRAFIASGILALLSVALAYVNYTKFALNGDHLFPRDFAMLKNAGGLVSFISGDSPAYFGILAVAALAWTAAFFIFKTEIKLNWKIRLPLAFTLVFGATFLFLSPVRAERTLNTFNMSFFDAALQNSNYSANGFLGAFTINLLSMNAEQPPGYSEEQINGIMAGYEETSSRLGSESFDVIAVLSESFFDVRGLNGVEFSKNPLPNYDAILNAPDTYSGMMYSTAIFGGTVRPEFELLTGLTTDYLPSGSIPYEYVSSSIETFVSRYRDAGFRTIALHPYDKKFYSRNLAYGFLGFDEFYGIEEIESIVTPEYKRGYLTDGALLQAIKHVMEESDAPVFMFVITMQNHQPFARLDESEISIRVSSALLTGNALDAVTTYTQGLADNDKMLGGLREYIDKRERPTAMLFFGDHLPSFGAETYSLCGMFGPDGDYSQAELETMYSSPFILYANRNLPGGLFTEKTGNKISSYYMLLSVASLTGFPCSPYMNLLNDLHASVSYHNVRLNQPVTERTERLTHVMRHITYDRLLGEGYSQ
jgi:phosphoglycerol transferase MdoB-like AlkP superfamily enzyme